MSGRERHVFILIASDTS